MIDPHSRIENKPSSNTINSVTPDNSENSKAPTDPERPISFDIDPEFPKEAKEMLQSVLTRFEHCFINKIEEVRIMRHVPKIKLRLKSDRVIKAPTYRLAPLETKLVREQINKMEKAGLIRKSNSE